VDAREKAPKVEVAVFADGAARKEKKRKPATLFVIAIPRGEQEQISGKKKKYGAANV